MSLEKMTYMLEIEDKILSPLSARSCISKGRKHPEKPHPYRSDFQRDRERIIHSKAFRRLEYKTQVFINHEGDHYRTRLTHTIEVAQISRTISRALRINEDLAESIALAHDLGHTPFGHAGERELNNLLKKNGGFEHNRQSLRVVEVLEKRYSGFKGLNLTWETREGIIKHSPPYDSPDLSEYSPSEWPSLEAQIIDIADEIAYNSHDLDDGIASGLLNSEEIESLEIWKMAKKMSSGELSADSKLLSREIIRNIINIQASDLINNTIEKIKNLKINDYHDIRHAGEKLAAFTPEVHKANTELKEFLRKKMYQHYKVARMTIKAQMVIRELFTIYTEHPDTLPGNYTDRIRENGILLTATDYIAGMTDRFALKEHKKLTDPTIGV